MTYNSQLGQQQVFNMVLPSSPVIVPQSADLRSIATTDFDLSPLIDKQTLDFISGAWVDNTANAYALTLSVAGSQQNVIFPAGCQGYLPLLAPNAPKFVVSSPSVPGIIIPIIFYNVPLLPYMINTAGQTISGTVSVSGTVTVNQTAHAFADKSLALDGTNQTIVAAGGANSYFVLQNPSGNNAVSINVAGGNSLTHGISIPGGGSYELNKGVSNAVTISGTNGQSVIAFAG